MKSIFEEDVTWGRVTRWMYGVSWTFVGLFVVLAVVAILTGDDRFAWTALIASVFALSFAGAGGGARRQDYGSRNLDVRSRERAYRERVDVRRPYCVVIGLLLLLTAAGLGLATIWVDSALVYLLPVPVGAGILTAGMASKWDG